MKLSEIIAQAPDAFAHDVQNPVDGTPDFDPPRAYYAGFWQGMAYERGCIANVDAQEVLDGLHSQRANAASACVRFERQASISVEEKVADDGEISPAEQILIDSHRLQQATAIVGQPASIEAGKELAIRWAVRAMQEACNRDYWKERAEAAERLLGMKVETTKDGSVHIQAPPEGLVLEGVSTKGKDA